MSARAFVSYYLLRCAFVPKAAGALTVTALATEKLHLQAV